MTITSLIKIKISCLFLLLLFAGSAHINAQCDSTSVELDFPDGIIVANPGDVITIPLIVNNFNDMVIFVFAINFRSSVLEYVSANPQISGLPSFGDAQVISPFGPDDLDIIRVIWSSPNIVGESLPDGSTLIELQFRVIGQPGTCGNVLINAAGLNAQISFISDINGVTVENSIRIDGVCLDDVTTDGGAQICVEPEPGPDPEGFITGLCGTTAPLDEGVVELSIFNGVGPYTVRDETGTVFNVDPATNVFIDTALMLGTKTYVITDANGLSSVPLSVEITSAPPFSVTPTDIRLPRCPTDNNGRITIEVSGGRPYSGGQYEFNWGPQQFGRKTGGDELLRLGNGTYMVTISDSLGCKSVETFDLNRSDVTINIDSQTDAICSVRNGRVIASASGGGPFAGGLYSFELTGTAIDGRTIEISQDQVGQALFIVPPGDYIITAADSTGAGSCPNQPMNMVTVGVSREQSVTITTDNTGCPAENESATITLNSSDGNTPTPIDITITDEMGMQVFSGSEPAETFTTACLPRGTYDITITDAQGCPIDTSFTISGCSLTVSDTIITQPSCSGALDGSITITAENPAGNVQYLWNTGDTTSAITNQTDGSYSVTISDGLDCEIIQDFTLVSPNPIDIVISALTVIQCPNGIGDLAATPSGGSGIYRYMWSTGDTTSVITGVTAGNYVVTVNDNNGCSNLDSFLLTDPSPPGFSITNPQAPDCQGDSSGTAAVTIIPTAEFMGPFFFLSSTGQTGMGGTFQVSNFPAGTGDTNWVVFSDGVCPFDTIFIDIPEAEVLAIDRDSSVIRNLSCFGDQGIDGGFVNLVGTSSGAITFRWPDLGPNVIGNTQFLDAGTYTVILESGNCSIEETLTITQPDSLEAFIDPLASIFANCGGDNNSILSLGSRGGIDSLPLVYRWEDAVGSVISTDVSTGELGPGSYFATITDANGCEAFVDTTITEPEPVIATLGQVRDPLCTGDLGQIFVASASGGSGAGYRYQVNTIPAMSIADTFDVIPGDYVVRVFDQNGCEFDTMVSINMAPTFTVSTGPDVDIELGSTTTLDVSINGANPVNMIVWTPENFVTCITNSCDQAEVNPFGTQLFTATVTDSDGCVATDDVVVNVQTSRNVYMPSAFSPNAIRAENSIYRIFPGAGVAIVNSFSIFDRWGNLVHEENNLPPSLNGSGSWDGRFQNKNAISGVYVCVVEVTYIDGETEIRKQDLTLIR